MPFELTEDGLITQSFEELFAEIGQKLQSIFGPTLNTDLASVNGQFMRVMSELRALDQQVALAVYRSFDPNGAVGTALDARAALTGTVRRDAVKSTNSGRLIFNAPGVVNDGTAIRNDDNGTLWQTILGPYTDTGGPFPETVPAVIEAIDDGPVQSSAANTWTLQTPLAFIDEYDSTDNFTLGRLEETNAELRYRRTVELFARGQGPLVAIAGILSKVDTENGTVDTVRVYHNPDEAPTDADGIPFKAFNAVLETTPTPPPAALQQDIFDALLTALGAGGEAHGTDFTGTAIDAEGQPQDVAFDLVDTLPIFVAFTLQTAIAVGGDGPVIPSDALQMAEVVRDASVAAGQDRARFNRIGRDVREIDYIGVVQELLTAGELQGVFTIDVDLSIVAKVGPYISDFVPVGIRQRPQVVEANIRVVIDGVVQIA